MIIHMITSRRPQQHYDYRLRDLVYNTGDLTIATDLGVPRGGSENSDHHFSGNSDHLPVALPDQKIVGGSASGEGKDDRNAEAARDS
ncbi:MAG TPA: hypothetical protein VKE51_37190, partial [Vicinamibacterales bacterium]|nr:hypothetical protein [Vicinamibacterales bacterium]